MLHPFRLPFTISFLSLMVAANIAAGVVDGELEPKTLNALGFGLRALSNLELWRFVTAIFLSHDAGMFVRQLVFATLVIAACEWREGTTRTTIFFVVTDVSASLLTAGALWIVLSMSGTEGTPMLASLDVGMSGGGFGLLGVLCAGLGRGRGAVAIGIVLIGLLLKPVFAADPLADILHPVAFLVGLSLRGLTRPRPA